jgi:hypothetical protein
MTKKILVLWFIFCRRVWCLINFISFNTSPNIKRSWNASKTIRQSTGQAKSLERVTALVFDTMASSTGRLNGCVILLERQYKTGFDVDDLSTSRLWSPDQTFKKRARYKWGNPYKKPSNPIFVRFQNEWDSVKKTHPPWHCWIMVKLAWNKSLKWLRNQ